MYSTFQEFVCSLCKSTEQNRVEETENHLVRSLLLWNANVRYHVHKIRPVERIVNNGNAIHALVHFNNNHNSVALGSERTLPTEQTKDAGIHERCCRPFFNSWEFFGQSVNSLALWNMNSVIDLTEFRHWSHSTLNSIRIVSVQLTSPKIAFITAFPSTQISVKLRPSTGSSSQYFPLIASPVHATINAYLIILYVIVRAIQEKKHKLRSSSLCGGGFKTSTIIHSNKSNYTS
jgi:hypothetical protein